MQRPQLDLSVLHTPYSSQTLKAGGVNQSGASPSAVIFSRRDLLKLTGVAAIGCSQSLSAWGAALQGPFEFVGDDERAAFKIGDRERWVIDTRRFGGKPVLKTVREDHLIRLELVNAMYPGTELSADLSCEIRRQLSGWRMRLTLALGEFTSEVPFEDWLTGSRAAVSGVSLDNFVCKPGGTREMLMRGTAQAEFSPDWMLKLAGDGVCRVSGFGGEILSDFVALSLLDPAEQSLTTHPAAKRTLISLRRGERSWNLAPMPDSADGWKVQATDSSFDLLHLETGESDAGRLSGQALLAESSAAGATLTFSPSAHLTGSDGKLFALPLRNARYAIKLDTDEEQAALVARFGEEPVWLHHQSLGVELGDTEETTHFELVCLNGRLKSLSCSPAILRVASTLPGAIVEHGPTAKGRQLSFHLDAPESAQTHHAPGHNAPGSSAPSGLLRIDGEKAEQPNISLSLELEHIEVLRPDDLLLLNFDFKNLSLDDSLGTNTGRKVLMVRKTDATLGAQIIVRFPPQHILEEVFEENALPKALLLRRLPEFLAAHFQVVPKFPIKARVSGESILVFGVPDAVQPFPYTLKSLLDWGRFEARLASNALPPPAPQSDLNSHAVARPLRKEIQPPKFEPTQNLKLTTRIEVPTSLWLSPHAAAAWAHAREAVTHNGRTELWHTRLGVKGTDGNPEAAGLDDAVDERNDYYRTLRAIESVDGDPFPVSLSKKNRKELVGLTSDLSVPGALERVIHAERFMLTALGAWMNVFYAADPPQGFELEEWRHRMTMGREHYVRVVTKGYLFPFGHRASLITITERKFRKIPGNANIGEPQKGQVGAFLLQRRFIIVRQPLKLYGPTEWMAKEGGFGDSSLPFKDDERVHRMMPFKSVRLTTLVTPNLQEATNKEVLKTTDNQPFLFHLIAEDKDGQLIDFTAPLMFVSAATEAGGTSTSDKNSGAFDAAAVMEFAKTYASQDQALRQRPLQGQRVSFVPNTGSTEPGATAFETDTITFDAFVSKDVASFEADQPAFVPVVAQSVVRVQAIEQLAGNSEKPSVRFHSAYLVHEFDANQGNNPGEVFFELTSNKITLDFSGQADKAGGLATPSTRIDGLSRKFGAVGDSTALAGGQFDPKAFFDSSAKILGGISLSDIISNVFNNDTVPRMANTIVRDANGVPLQNRTELLWKPVVASDPKSLFVPKPGNEANTLSLTAKIVTPLSGSGAATQEPPFYVNGLLQNFALNFFGLLQVHFTKLELTMQSGKKLDVSAALEDPGAVTFGGPLSFLNVLATHIPSTGFSDPPSLDVTSSGVSVGYSLGLPAISAGAWGIRDLSIGATLTIPFTGADSTRLRFNFSERHNPFQVSAYGVTGGAFLAITIGLGRVEVVEASVELGGSLALNLGVASGAVFLMIGIHLTMVNAEPQNQVSLGGYVRLGGAVSVLGLITVSVEFYMELAYLVGPPSKMRGEASLTVKVKVLFFSKKVTLTVVRELDAPGLAAARPLDRPDATETAHLANEQAWERYCEAFA